VPLVLAWTVFGSITGNFFHTDDFFHLYTIVQRGAVEFLLLPFGGHMLLARNAVFYLCHRAFGTDPVPYFRLVLLTHLLNVLLLFRVTRLFTGSRLLACAAALLWGTCPIHEGALGWYSVYGHVLVGTLLLLVLGGVGARLDDTPPVRVGVALWWALLLFVAATSFGVGMAVTLAFPAVIALLLPPARISRVDWAIWITTALGAVAFYVWLLARANMESSRGGALPTLFAFASYGVPIATMWAHLLGYGTSALLLGAFGSRDGYPGLASGVTIGVVAVAATAAALSASPTVRRRMLGLVLLAGAIYVSIALGRAALYVSFFKSLAQPASEARYHYAALLPVTVVLAMIVHQLGGGRAAEVTVLAAVLAAVVGAHAAFPTTIDHHDADRRAVAETIAAIRAKVATRPPGATVIIPNESFFPAGLLGDQFPGTAGLFIIYFPSNVVDGRYVYFGVTPTVWRAAAPRSSRLASLLLPTMPPSVPPKP
jgi:hypothetical protein